MNLDEIKIGQKVWVMVNNKPVAPIVSKIIRTDELSIIDQKPRQTITAFASYSDQYRHELTLVASDTFSTSQELEIIIMQIVKFIIDQENKKMIYCNHIPRIAEDVIINEKIHFVDNVIYDLDKAEVTVYLLSQEI
jgi:hypothetical protein